MRSDGPISPRLLLFHCLVLLTLLLILLASQSFDCLGTKLLASEYLRLQELVVGSLKSSLAGLHGVVGPVRGENAYISESHRGRVFRAASGQRKEVRHVLRE